MPTIQFDGIPFTGTYSSSTSFTATSSLNISVGTVLFVGVRQGQSSTVTSVSDSVGNVYTLVAQTTAFNTASMYCGVVKNAITTTTVLTVNASVAATSANPAIVQVYAFSNVDTITPFGSVSTGTQNSVLDYTATSSVSIRHGSMLLALVTVNDRWTPTVISGSITNPSTMAQPWMNFGYRQNPDLTSYSLTYRRVSGAGNWGSVLAEINRTPSDFFLTI